MSNDEKSVTFLQSANIARHDRLTKVGSKVGSIVGALDANRG